MRQQLITCAAILFFIAGCGGARNQEHLLKEGNPAPGFQVADQNGKMVSLAELHENGPLVLTFLRSFY